MYERSRAKEKKQRVNGALYAAEGDPYVIGISQADRREGKYGIMYMYAAKEKQR